MLTNPPIGKYLKEYSVSLSPCSFSSASDISEASLPNFSITLVFEAPKVKPIPPRHARNTGPIPTAKALVLIPAHFAAMKCPSSCKPISIPKPRTIKMMFHNDAILMLVLSLQKLQLFRLQFCVLLDLRQLPLLNSTLEKPQWLRAFYEQYVQSTQKAMNVEESVLLQPH